jgi:hypothetical protein
MARGKKHTAEQIVNLLRQVEVGVANGKLNAETNRLRLGVSQEALEIAKDRLSYGTETGTVTTPTKSASALEDTAQVAEARLKNPTPIGDTGIVMEWFKSQIAGPARMNNVELEQALSSGTLNQQ